MADIQITATLSNLTTLLARPIQAPRVVPRCQRVVVPHRPRNVVTHFPRIVDLRLLLLRNSLAAVQACLAGATGKVERTRLQTFRPRVLRRRALLLRSARNRNFQTQRRSAPSASRLLQPLSSCPPWALALSAVSMSCPSDPPCWKACATPENTLVTTIDPPPDNHGRGGGSVDSQPVLRVGGWGQPRDLSRAGLVLDVQHMLHFWVLFPLVRVGICPGSP